MSDVDAPELSTVQEGQAQAQAQAAELASAQAGYARKARGEQPPAEPVEVLTEKAPTEFADDASGESNGGATPEAGEAVVKVEDELKALKAKVSELASGSAEQRKMYGEIGNINRTLKQLQTAKEAPADSDELAAAIKKAEEVASDFPEIGGPLVHALKVLGSKQQVVPDLDERIQKAVLEDRQKTAIELRDEAHPDRHELKETPEFKAWFASKTPEYQEKINLTWNPAVLSQCFTDFKKVRDDERAARQKKQNRLDAAVTPKGTPTKAQPSTLSDEQAAMVGYNRRRRHF